MKSPVPAAEIAAIGRWAGRLPTVGQQGDDCVVLDGASVFSVDASVEGVHFRLDWGNGEDAGYRALARALSDLAAAAAEPVAALLSVVLKRGDLAEGALGDRLADGFAEAARRFGCPIGGGDTAIGPGPRVLTVTVIGRADTPRSRAGALPGDVLQISGDTGWAALGVARFASSQRPPDRARAAHLRPTPRLDLRSTLAAAHACIDVSDGLLLDAIRLGERSGVALRLDRAACVPESLRAETDDAERFALSGGDDYELLAAAPSLLQGFRALGRVEVGAGVSFDDGSLLPAFRGWEHP